MINIHVPLVGCERDQKSNQSEVRAQGKLASSVCFVTKYSLQHFICLPKYVPSSVFLISVNKATIILAPNLITFLLVFSFLSLNT